MPTYEYICRACGHEFEEFHSITAAPIAVCPKCRKKKVERKISGGGAVIFKGGGFYETDYRSDSYRSGADADKKASEGSTGGKAGDASGGKTEGKTDGKTGGKTDGSAPAGKSEAKSDRNAEPRAAAPSETASSSSSSASSSASSTSSSKTAAEPASGTAAKSSDADAENRRIESRATHASRIGRGVGNIAPKAPPSKAKRPRG